MPDLPLTQFQQPTDAGDSPVEAGAFIAGKYKLLEPIGEGGMGAVWMAQQIEPVKRPVAVKLIKAGMDSKAVLARFEAERQALALMDHPNIAKVLDAGTTTGRPFFVMELVKGVPITEFCDARRLTPRQRLELFVPVCQAIQHAHQKGIIHRDIKPSNVLVALHDDKPVPKVIDFGVAKAMSGQPLTEKTLHTGFDAIVGTPAYMSPEQATFNQLDIDTRTDVYSLGVLLYELLTGTTPIERERFKKAALLEMLRVVREEEPPRPSTRLSSTESKASIAAVRGTEPARLTKEFRGELDWIAMKALEKDRSRRYDTANGLARDVERYLADEVVEARPPSMGYRMRKFLRKHRGPALAVGLLAGVLAAGAAGTVYGLVQAREAADREQRRADGEAAAKAEAETARTNALALKDRAEQSEQQTREVLDAMVSEVTGDSLSTQKAISPEQKKFLEGVLGYYQKYATAGGSDEKARKRMAYAAFRVGMIESRLGRLEQGVAAYQRAIVEYSGLVADFQAVPGYRSSLAQCHSNLGVLLAELGKLADAESAYRTGLVLFDKLAADFPAVPAYRCDLAGSHSNLANLLSTLGKLPEAESAYRAGLLLFEKLAAEFPAVPEYRQYLARSRNNLASLLTEQLGRRSEAESAYRAGLLLFEKLAAEFPTVPIYRDDLAHCYTRLGPLLMDMGKQSEAEKACRAGLAIQEKLTTEFPAFPHYRRDLALSHSILAVLLSRLGRQSEAESEYQAGLLLFEKLAAEFPAIPDYRRQLAHIHDNLGSLLTGLGKQLEAEKAHRACLALREKLATEFPAVSEYRSELARSHSRLALFFTGLRRLSEAESAFRAGLAIQEKLATDFPAVSLYRVDLGGTYCNLGNLLRNTDRLMESLGWYEKAISTLSSVYEAGPRAVNARQFLRNSHLGRADALMALQRYADAVPDWDKALALDDGANRAQFEQQRAICLSQTKREIAPAPRVVP